MTITRLISCVVLTAAVLAAGCERDDTGDTGTTTGGTAGASGTSGTGTSGTGATGTDATATIETPAAAPTPAATPDATTASNAAAAAATEAPTTAPAAVTPQQAQTLIDQTVTYIKENKMDLAEKSLTQLEQLKPKIPVEYHSKIDGVRKAFNTAKTGQGLKLDGLVPSGAK